MAGLSTTDAIFILKQMQEKHLLKRMTLYASFADLYEVFGRSPRKMLCWSLAKLGVDDWVICLAKSMYSNGQSTVQVSASSSE